MEQKIKEKIREAFSAVLPITGIVLIISVFLVPMDVGNFVMFLVGAVMLVIGMGFFQLGAEMSMTPLGEGIGVVLSKTRSLAGVIVIAFLMGTIITLAEPDLQVLAEQVPSIPNEVLTWAVAIGVGIFFVIAVLRILLHIKLSALLFGLYLILAVVSCFAPQDFLAVSFDSGGVTTGPMTVPFIMAMGVGMASVRGDKDAADDSFGLVALSSIGPVLAVLILGCFYRPEETSYSLFDVAKVFTTRDVAREFVTQIPGYVKEVFVSLIPILAVFVLFQLISKRYRKRQVKKILIGFGYTYLGLVLFLCGVNVGFSTIGALMGRGMAEGTSRWLLLPVGMVIGYCIVKAEPAIQILNRQVEEVTDGVVSEREMNRCMSIGVSVSVGLAMLRILLGFPIYWILIPGYVIALVLSRIVPKIFVGIAFDSGGVASGPMTTTFLLPLSIGACDALGGNIMTDAFGVVALVALTPLIAVQLMGARYKVTMQRAERNALQNLTTVEKTDDIVEIEESKTHEYREETAIDEDDFVDCDA